MLRWGVRGAIKNGGEVCRLSGQFCRLNRGPKAASRGSGGRSPRSLLCWFVGRQAPQTRRIRNETNFQMNRIRNQCLEINDELEIIYTYIHIHIIYMAGVVSHTRGVFF